ncbi:MAG: DNA polymerase III subunit delta, partial [Burkholderiales bacterium]|nr:DNA polymerase III subunit delta [Burkholderiales bacterium]
SGKPGKDGSEALQRYCEQVAGVDGVFTLVQLPRLDFQQSKAAWFTALDNAGVTVRVETLDRKALPAWLAQRLARQGQRVRAGEDGERALAFFADRVEGNLLAAHQELQKLALLHPAGERALAFLADRVEGNLLAAHQELQKLALLHPAGELGLAQIEAAVLDVARYDIAKFTEAVWGGQVARALRMLDSLRAEGESAVFVHWSLAEDLRALARGRGALDEGKPLPLALREARAWGPKERLFERVLPALSDRRLTRLLGAASLCDGIVKGLKQPGWPHEPWEALRRLVLVVLQALPAPPAAGAQRVLALR